MPELPEVQTIVNELNASGLIGHRINDLSVLWPKTMATNKDQLAGETIKGFSRRAKFIVIQLSHGYILIHLRMSGSLSYSGAQEPRSPYERVVILFDNGKELRFIDPRKFGRIYYVKSMDLFFKAYGPEPLDASFKWQTFTKMLQTKRRQIKPLLLDQKFIAGLGNIYTDEALWLAKLHPLRMSDSISKKESRALFQAIQAVLKRGIRFGGTSLGTGKSNYSRLSGDRGKHVTELNVYRRNAKACPRCHSPIDRIIVGQRATHFCRFCQK